MSYIHFGNDRQSRQAHFDEVLGWFSAHTTQDKKHTNASTESFVAFASDLQPKLPRHNNKLMDLNRAR
jgi:hypothetical protein